MLFVFNVWDYSLVIYRWKFPLFVVPLINKIMSKKDLVLFVFRFFLLRRMNKKRSWIVEIFCRFDFIWLRIMKFYWIFFCIELTTFANRLDEENPRNLFISIANIPATCKLFQFFVIFESERFQMGIEPENRYIQ